MLVWMAPALLLTFAALEVWRSWHRPRPLSLLSTIVISLFVATSAGMKWNVAVPIAVWWLTAALFAVAAGLTVLRAELNTGRERQG